MTSTGLEPMASALALQCSTYFLAEKTHTLGAGQFVEFNLTREIKGMKLE